MQLSVGRHRTGYFPAEVSPKRVNPKRPRPHLGVFHLGQETLRLGDEILWVKVHQIIPCTLEVRFYETLQVIDGNGAVGGPWKVLEGVVDDVEGKLEGKVHVGFGVKVVGLVSEGCESGFLEQFEE